MVTEDEMLSSWREQLRQQQSSSVSESTTPASGTGGGEEQEEEEEEEMRDENSNIEKTVTDSESEEQFREAMRQEKYRKKKRQHSGDDGGGEDTDCVPGNIPIDLLRKISPLCEKLGLTMRQQLSLAMGFVELCGELEYTGCFLIGAPFKVSEFTLYLSHYLTTLSND